MNDTTYISDDSLLNLFDDDIDEEDSKDIVTESKEDYMKYFQSSTIKNKTEEVSRHDYNEYRKYNDNDNILSSDTDYIVLEDDYVNLNHEFILYKEVEIGLSKEWELPLIIKHTNYDELESKEKIFNKANTKINRDLNELISLFKSKALLKNNISNIINCFKFNK